MDKLAVLRGLVRSACPKWIRVPRSTDPVAFLQEIIDQVLPGALGVTIDQIGEGEIRGVVPFRKETANVAGLMHGATIFALGDTLAGALLWFMSDGSYYGVSASCSITYLRPITDGSLHCRVFESRRSERRIYLVAQFTSDTGRRVARLKMEYAILPISPPP